MKVDNGFRDIYGVVWTDAEVQAYNRISHEIDCRIEAGREVPEWMKDARHRQYCTPYMIECNEQD